MMFASTHQNSLASIVCFLRLSLSAMEMVDHSLELQGSILGQYTCTPGTDDLVKSIMHR